jgi:hypothetical protein
MNFGTPENFKPHFSVLIEAEPIQSNGLNMTFICVRLAAVRRVAEVIWIGVHYSRGFNMSLILPRVTY